MAEVMEEELKEEPLLLATNVELLNLTTQYQQLMVFYEAGIAQITAKLQILNREFQCGNDRNPIENIKSRVKSPESITKKMQKKGLPPTVECLTKNIYDVGGIRVICPFVSDVYYVAQMLLQQEDIKVIKIKDYIRSPKANGYRSLHIIVMVDVYFSDGKKSVPIEIQIRTIAMNSWASLEHQMRYKKEWNFTEDMQESLKECAELMARADEKMQHIASKLPDFAYMEE